MKSWEQYFIELTLQVASKSKDPSRQVGCVVVGSDREIRSTGFNGFPRDVTELELGTYHCVRDEEYDLVTRDVLYKCSCGEVVTQSLLDHTALKTPEHFMTESKIELSTRWDRPQKYQWVEHAERNAIYNAARVGVSLLGCTAYVSLAPCVGCSRGLIQAGITKVVAPAFPTDPIITKEYHFDIASEMLHEAGVEYVVANYEKEDTT